MSDVQFFQTRMGQQFYDGTLPKIAKALERIAGALEARHQAAKPNPPTGTRFTLTVHITAGSAAAAQALRNEVVGAIEDAHEARTIDAVADISALTPYNP